MKGLPVNWPTALLLCVCGRGGFWLAVRGPELLSGATVAFVRLKNKIEEKSGCASQNPPGRRPIPAMMLNLHFWSLSDYIIFNLIIFCYFEVK